MKTKYETLKSVVEYVSNESDDPISELLMMGFTPCQLVFEFGFDADEVKSSEIYAELDDDLDENAYPFLLGKYSPFDAALVNWFKLSTDSLIQLKDTDAYIQMKERYEEEKEEALMDVMNAIFGKFEDLVYERLGENYKEFESNS